MKLVTKSDVNQHLTLTGDICIIGSGPAGTTLAEKLLHTGKKVILVESGLTEPDDNIQKLNQIHCSGHPVRSGFINRLRMLGGTSNLWPGRCMPLEPIDFKYRDWVPNSGWPIAFEEYASYLPGAAALLNIPDTDIKQFVANQQAFDPRVSLPSLSAKLAVWGKSAKRFKQNFSNSLDQYPNLTLLRGFTAHKFIFNQAGDALHKVLVSTLCGKQITIQSSEFVIACGGIENPRLLLLAKMQNPHAHLNNDNIGRFFMDHPRIVKGNIRLNHGVDWSAFIGHPIKDGLRQFGIGISEAHQQQHKTLNSYVYLEPYTNELAASSYDNTIQSLKRILRKGHTGRRFDFSNPAKVKHMVYQLTPKEVLPNWLYRIYFALRKLIKPHKRHLVVINHCEQVPDPDSRVTLSNELDTFGNPLANLHWKINQMDCAAINTVHLAINNWLTTEGLGRFDCATEPLDSAEFEDASHHIGTTRMSLSAATGVVDTNLKVHGIANLYMCGSSIFPTSGSCNPTLSIVAFAIRLAKHLEHK